MSNGEFPSVYQSNSSESEDTSNNHKTRDTIVNLTTAVGLAGGQAIGPSAAINAQKLAEDRNNEENTPKAQQIYTEDEDNQQESEFTFVDSSVGSGLDEDGFALNDKKDQSQEPILTKKIVDSLNVENWFDYTLEKIEEIVPTSYLPIPVSTFYYEDDQIEGLFDTSLFVLPISKKTQDIDLSSPILEYNLKPSVYQAFNIEKKFTVRTNDNTILTFGGFDGTSGDLHDSYLLVLMGVATEDGKDFQFFEVEESPKETISRQNSLWASHGYFDLNFSQIDYDSLFNKYNPESGDWNDRMIITGAERFLEQGEKEGYFKGDIYMGSVYSTKDIENFLDVFSAYLDNR